MRRTTSRAMAAAGRFSGLLALAPAWRHPHLRAFVNRVAAVDKLKIAHRVSLAEMDALFASLQHRAFRGEL